jgi:hypothetical protein
MYATEIVVRTVANLRGPADVTAFVASGWRCQADFARYRRVRSGTAWLLSIGRAESKPPRGSERDKT